MNHFTTPIFNYCKALYEHDWTYEFSDDHSVWQRGRASLGELQQLQPKIDPDFVIWNKFAPSDFQRKPQAPAPAPEVQQDGWNEPYNCIAAGPTATDVALWQAMNEATKYGNRDDDKLIRKALNDAGYYLVRSMKKPGTCEHLLAAPCAAVTHPAWQPIETAPKDGRLILVNFGCKGVRAVSWGSPFHDDVTEENGLWCVDDDKHGPFPLRGYCAAGPTAPTHWMPLPDAPVFYVPVQGSGQ